VASFVLIPGAGGSAFYWHLVVPRLQAHGHDVVAVELPAADDSAGLDAYTTTVVDATGDRSNLVIVAQSLGGFTGPLVCDRIPVRLLVLLNAMVPSPGETAGDWWTNTGHAAARQAQAAREGRTVGGEADIVDAFFHDVPPEVKAAVFARGEPAQSSRIFEDPWPLPAWPDVETRLLQGRDDRFFPVEFQRRIARERLAIVPEEIPGGHLLALSQPTLLAERLHAFV
jgi:pimeloyl-ACP methyl ester carboxylesterase